MNKIVYILMVLLVFSSCESELELSPTSSLTYNGFWDSEEGANAAHTGLYSSFRGYSSTLWKLGEIRSDIWGGNTVESPSDMSLITQTISATQVPFTKWADFYKLIHRMNDFLVNVPNIDFVDENKKNHMLGQVYGMRAFVYFTLLKTWGQVPISTEPQVAIDPSMTSKERSSEADVMALIKSDLALSLEYFGSDDSFWKGKRIYWSKAATLLLKGEAFIWSGKHVGGGNSDYSSAKDALTKLSALDVELLDNYADLWDINNENNKEYVFSFSYEVDQATNFYGSFTGRGTEINPLFDENGNPMTDFVTNGANRYGPTDGVLQAIDDIEDTRRNATFIRLYSDDAGYIPYASDNYTTSILAKFLGMIESGARIQVSDVPVYRYADGVLLLAEAKNLLGEDPSSEINQIRQRAYGENYVAATHAYSNGSSNENIQTILDERLKEFIGEGKRWWDLRRAGDNWVIENNEYLSSGDEYKLVLPISLDMIGRNPLLEQTAGY